MPVPAYDLGLVLPPFLGAKPGVIATQSPYLASTLEIVERFGTTPARNTLLRGYLNLRSALRAVGIDNGFQWIDGSFVENKEIRLGQAPGDIDVVTVFERPTGMTNPVLWSQFQRQHAQLFDPGHCKTMFLCEAFYIDAGRSGTQIASLTAFWFGLFSHQKDTFRWKGVVRCALGPANLDRAADAELTKRGF